MFARLDIEVKIESVELFKKHLVNPSCGQCLIVAKQSLQAQEVLFERWGRPTKCYDKETFSSERFLEEIETRPLLSDKIILHVKEIDKLRASDLNTLLVYLKRPNPWALLLLTASQLSRGSKLAKAVEQRGVVLWLEEKKTEKNLADWLIHQAAIAGVAFPVSEADVLVKSLGYEQDMLQNELEKLICYVGKRRKITAEDISKISCKKHLETLWKLGDAIFSLDNATAWRVGRSLMEEGMVFFPLLASMRTQIRTGLEILSQHLQGGGSAVTKAFPYLKGWLLEKKLKMLRRYGKERLQRALIVLFETEIQAKNSATDHALLLQILLTRLTRQN